jgi:hypothetical protein
MSNWALLKAVADGGAAYLAKKDEQKKQALMERLEKERREYARQLEIDREARAERREAARVARPRTVEKDGILFEQDINSSGDVINERLLDRLNVDRIRTEEQKNKLSLENEVLQGDVLRAKAKALPLEQALGMEATRANIDQSRASAEASRASARRQLATTEGVSNPEEALADWGKDIGNKLIKSGVMTKTEYEEWVRSLVAKARELHINAAKLMEMEAKHLLEGYDE